MLQKFLPTDEETIALRKYTNSANVEEIDQLSDCEKYMLAMMEVPGINSKFDCMVFQMQFQSRLNGLMDEINLVDSACESVRQSYKLKKLLATVLTLGNQINSGGTNRDVAAAFKLETLLKLNEVSNFF